MIDNRTPNYSWPLIHPDNDQEDDVPRLLLTLLQIDALIASIQLDLTLISPEGIGALPFDGTAVAAQRLATAIQIAGVGFDGRQSIDLPGVNIPGNQDTSGNAATATKLRTPCRINGVLFDGAQDITLTAQDIDGIEQLIREKTAMTPMELPFTSSGTFTAPVTAEYLIAACGAGSNGTLYNGTGTRGGAAGGFAFKRVRLTAGQQVQIVIGASTSTAGGKGGDTTVIGPGIHLICQGGSAAVSGQTTLGGTASGGDANFDGGDAQSFGGAAVSMFGSKANAVGNNGASPFPAGSSSLPPGFTREGGAFHSMFGLLGRSGISGTAPGEAGGGTGNPSGPLAGGSAGSNGGIGAGGGGAAQSPGQFGRGGQGFAVIRWSL